MAQTQQIFSTDGEVYSGPRSPLSPLMPAQVNVLGNQVKRKTSFQVRVDSSEDLPSPHESIFEALCASNYNNENADDKFDPVSVLASPGLTAQVLPILNNENVRQGQLDESRLDDVEFLYGRGTVLDTITEQRSCGTMRTQATGDVGLDLPSFPFARHRDSFALNQQPARRKQAFSHDDISLIQASYHDACAMIEREACKPLPVHAIYAEPNTPIHEPVERPGTPVGMPSWTASQNNNPLRHVPSLEQTAPTIAIRFRRFFRLAPTTPLAAPAVRSVSDPVRGRQAPRFRPPRSVYGNIEQHPFNTAPKARVVSRPVESPRPSSMRGKNKNKIQSTLGVRFTPSATARDSEINTLRTAIENSSTLAPHPIEPFQESSNPTTPVVDIRCLHTKGRVAAAKQIQPLNHLTTDPPSFEYVIQTPNADLSTSREVPLVATTPTSDRPISPLSLVPSNSYTAQMESIIFRSPSISSTAHLMSGGLRNSPLVSNDQLNVGLSNRNHPDSNKIQVVECWKCRLEKVGRKFDTIKKRGINVLYFVCCGHDVRDDENSGLQIRGGYGRESLLAPRIVSLEGRN